jgi:anthranilate synthase/aminodeoxychorismate synthase-like glutamine amidotransferase
VILLIDNYDSFTWNLVQRLGELDPSLEPGRDLVVVRNDKITPEGVRALDDGRGPSHIIVSPGPCTPKEAGVSGRVISAFAGRVPILGVCLGYQCIADEQGMVVERHPVLMHGKTSEVEHDGRGVFEGLPSPFTATRYHSLIVRASSVPAEPEPGEDGWIATAWCDDPESDPARTGERVLMGLRRVWGDPAWPDGTPKQPVEGVQFHPESFLTTEGPRLLANFLAMGERGRDVRGRPSEAMPG